MSVRRPLLLVPTSSATNLEVGVERIVVAPCTGVLAWASNTPHEEPSDVSLATRALLVFLVWMATLLLLGSRLHSKAYQMLLILLHETSVKEIVPCIGQSRGFVA